MVTPKAAVQANQAVDNTPTVTGPGGAGGLLNAQKDIKESSTEAKFGEVLNNIQAKYGAKAEKPREIKKQLGKDDFLRIMITQMRHQDPTSPFKPEQMAQEMAQFTSLEQLQNVNTNLTKMSQANQPLERLAMTNLIGKTVTVDRDRFPHTEGGGEALSFKLPRDAKNVSVSLIHESGETVFQKEIGGNKAGDVSFQWDGLKANRQPAKSGNYIMKIEAKDEQEKDIPISGQAQARVIGISFEGTEPVFLVGDAKSQTKVTMRNIIRVDDTGAMGAMAQMPGGGAGAASAGSTGSTERPNSLFTFQKGVGSQAVDQSTMPPEVAAALAKFQQQQAQGDKAPASAPAPSAGRSAGMAMSAPSSGNSGTAVGRPTIPPPSMAAGAGIQGGSPASGGAGSPLNAALAAAQKQAAGAKGIDKEKGFPNGLHD